jgi:cytoskeleton protein RodZ
MGAFGDKLKREREMRRITLDEISESTKIPRRYLESLERETFESLPGGVFNKGFVKAYARFLGLDEEQAVADYVAVAKEETPPEDQFPLEIHEKPDRELNPRKPQWPLIGAVIALVGVLGGYAVWRTKLRQPENSEATVAAASPSQSGTKATASSSDKSPDFSVVAERHHAPLAPVPSLVPKTQAADYKPKTVSAVPVKQVARLEADPGTVGATSTAGTQDATQTKPLQNKKNFFVVIKAKEDAWISVVADGRRVSHGTLRANKQRFIRADKQIILTTGNAGGIDVSFNGRPVGAIGSESEARTLMFTPTGQVQE